MCGAGASVIHHIHKAQGTPYYNKPSYKQYAKHIKFIITIRINREAEDILFSLTIIRKYGVVLVIHHILTMIPRINHIYTWPYN
jgi:hypothetical protein